MSNPYYNRVTDFIADTTVRSSDVDAELNAVVAGFDLLGDPTKVSNGGLMWGTDTGTANNYVFTNDSGSTLIAGQMITFAPVNSSTGASVVAVNGGSNLAIKRNDGSAVQANDLLVDVPVLLLYDQASTRWIIVGSTTAQTLAAFRPAVNSQTTTAYQLTASDENSITSHDNASAITITAPSTSTEDLPIGYISHHNQEGEGALSIAPDTGVTLRYAYGLTARAQYSSISVMKVAANTYLIVGDIG